MKRAIEYAFIASSIAFASAVSLSAWDIYIEARKAMSETRIEAIRKEAAGTKAALKAQLGEIGKATAKMIEYANSLSRGADGELAPTPIRDVTGIAFAFRQAGEACNGGVLVRLGNEPYMVSLAGKAGDALLCEPLPLNPNSVSFIVDLKGNAECEIKVKIGEMALQVKEGLVGKEAFEKIRLRCARLCALAQARVEHFAIMKKGSEYTEEDNAALDKLARDSVDFARHYDEELYHKKELNAVLHIATSFLAEGISKDTPETRANLQGIKNRVEKNKQDLANCSAKMDDTHQKMNTIRSDHESMKKMLIEETNLMKDSLELMKKQAPVGKTSLRPIFYDEKEMPQGMRPVPRRQDCQPARQPMAILRS